MAQQQQPPRPESVKYGDVFDVSGELASKPIAPQDAATVRLAQNTVLGITRAGGPAAAMQSAADVNESCGVVGHQDMTDILRDRGVTVTDSVVAGCSVVTEAIAGQVVGVDAERGGQGREKSTVDAASPDEVPSISIGKALETAALSSGDKPVSESDAAAIEAAVVRATGLGGGIAAEAKSAAVRNPRAARDEDKTILGDVLADASDKLPRDKTVTREDAEAVVAAETRSDPDMATHPGGVASSMAAAARSNLRNQPTQ